MLTTYFSIHALVKLTPNTQTNMQESFAEIRVVFVRRTPYVLQLYSRRDGAVVHTDGGGKLRGLAASARKA